MNATTEFFAPMPKIAAVKPAGHLTVEVTWRQDTRAGRTEVIDLAPVVGAYKFYKSLRDENGVLFATARVNDLGTMIIWGADDDELEMAATTVERLAEESMSAEDFKRFLDDNNLTHNAAALVLGYSRRQIEHFLEGQPIPRVVALACFGYAARKYTTRFTRAGAAIDYKKSRRVTTDMNETSALNRLTTTSEGVA
jgi:hypothetical protein